MKLAGATITENVTDPLIRRLIAVELAVAAIEDGAAARWDRLEEIGITEYLMEEKTYCLNPMHAGKIEANSRGLCKSCYSTALKAIKERLTTWEILMKAGKALEPTPPKPRANTIRAWLLDTPAETGVQQVSTTPSNAVDGDAFQ